MGTEDTIKTSSPLPHRKFSSFEIRITIYCLLGLFFIGTGLFLAGKESWHHEINSPFFAFIFSGIFFILFILGMAKFYRTEESIYRRGIFSLFISIIIIVAEILLRFLNICNPLSLVVLDFINGYVFIRARRILTPMASTIIEKYGEKVVKRKRFSLILIFSGILFIYLQIATLYLLFELFKIDSNILYVLFSFFQVVSAYWGYIITRLGIGIYTGYEPTFSEKARTKLEGLEEILLRRRESALLLEDRTAEECKKIKVKTLEKFSDEGSFRVYSNFNVWTLLPVLIAAGFFTGGFMGFLEGNIQTLLWATLIGMSIFLIGLKLSLSELKRRKNNYVEFSKAGIIVKWSTQKDNKKYEQEIYLWVEFMIVEGLGKHYFGEHQVALHAYNKPLRITFSSLNFKIEKIIKGIKQYIDAPEILSSDMGFLSLDKYHFQKASEGEEGERVSFGVSPQEYGNNS